MSARLVRDGNGGYSTPDGRWTVTPLTGMGAGVTGWAGGRGWSNGRKAWSITDTTGAVRLGLGGATKVVDHLYEARDLIAAHQEGAS